MTDVAESHKGTVLALLFHERLGDRAHCLDMLGSGCPSSVRQGVLLFLHEGPFSVWSFSRANHCIRETKAGDFPGAGTARAWV